MSSGEHTDPERARLDRALVDAARVLGLAWGRPMGTGGLAVALQHWLMIALEEDCGPAPALRGRLHALDDEERAAARHEVAAALHQAGSRMDERLAGRMAEDPRVAAPSGWLERARARAGARGWDLWLSRIAQLAFEHVLGDPVAPELQVELAPLGPGAVQAALAGRFTHAVVCGELLGFAGELFPLVLDARCHDLEQGGGPGINVLGVHREWLTDPGGAWRAIFFDHRREALIEASFLPALPLDAVQFLYLGAEHEQEEHQALSARLTRLVQANPYRAARNADRKWETYRLLRAAGVPTPATVLIPAGATPRRSRPSWAPSRRRRSPRESSSSPTSGPRAAAWPRSRPRAAGGPMRPPSSTSGGSSARATWWCDRASPAAAIAARGAATAPISG